jgi:hypothetical protein
VNSKNKIIVTIVSLIAWLFISGPVGAESIPISEQPHLTEVALSPLFVGGRIVGLVAVYDDPTTERPADRLQVYDNAGHLLVIGWFDKFGIQRMAVDRGLLDGEKLEGVFVVMSDGEPM